MRRYGFLKHSLVDYPGEVCSVVFMPGCNFHCAYCHNKNLLTSVRREGVFLKDIIGYLESAGRRFITGVCITGGEPTLYPETLSYLVSLFKEMNLKVKLDTNGSHPDQIRLLSDQVDYFAMDLKTVPSRYVELVNARDTIRNTIEESIHLLLNMPAPRCEFRTTLSWQYVDENVVDTLGKYMHRDTYWYLQRCHLKDVKVNAKDTVAEYERIARCHQIAKRYTQHAYLRE
ncbi:MAG: anaerobic ribonucleoside-triphosphate reductase activating protein [Puniceicoccales bacterium]|jgi:pyruvate formate lyase activating enzyme|nr:anaerobic ribonucleoside-triphosphate reductase activating protein [Puniceicoccales bacterium]